MNKQSKSLRRKIDVLLHNETNERAKLCEIAINFGELLLKLTKTNVETMDIISWNLENMDIHDFYLDIDCPIPNDSIWMYLIEMLKYKYKYDYIQKKNEYEDEITMLKRELDGWYGTNPEEGSPASFGKIADFGASRAESIKELNNWKEDKINKMQYIVNICLEFLL